MENSGMTVGSQLSGHLGIQGCPDKRNVRVSEYQRKLYYGIPMKVCHGYFVHFARATNKILMSG